MSPELKAGKFNDYVSSAAAVLGVLRGSQMGFWVGSRSRVKWLKLLMAAVLAAVSIWYFKLAFA